MAVHDIAGVREQIIAHLLGEATEQQSLLLQEWRASAPDNEAEYQRVAHAWDIAGRMHAGEFPAIRPGFLEEVAHRAVQTGTTRSPVPTQPSSAPRVVGWARRSWAGWAIAASLVAGLGLGTLLGLQLRGVDPGSTVLVTEADEHATVTLRDGTVVRLAPASELVFSDAINTRSVTLRGRAFFAVTQQEGQFFRVRLPEGVVEALGTRFGVGDSGEGLQLAVVEGEVMMAVRGERVMVSANQVATASEYAISEVREVDDVFQFVDWLGPFLVFSATPMADVAQEFLQRFEVRIQISDEDLLTRTVTGWFADRAPMQIIESICRAVGAECTYDDDVVQMRRARGVSRGASSGDASVAAPFQLSSKAQPVTTTVDHLTD